MDMLDPWLLIEWIYDPIEERYGRLAAWLTTFAAGLVVIGVLIWILIALTSR